MEATNLSARGLISKNRDNAAGNVDGNTAKAPEVPETQQTQQPGGSITESSNTPAFSGIMPATNEESAVAPEQDMQDDGMYDVAAIRHYNPTEEPTNYVDSDRMQSLLDEVFLDNSPAMLTCEWVGNSNMLLNYVTDMQSMCHLTLPLDSLGIDAKMFDMIEPSEDKTYIIGNERYELLEIDGHCYLSCSSAEIDKKHFQDVTRDMLSSLYDCGSYTLYRSQFRIFQSANGTAEGPSNTHSDADGRCLIYALNLNTFELQALYKYLSNLPGASYKHGRSEDGRAILEITLEDVGE